VEIGEDLPIRFRELNALSKISHVRMPLGRNAAWHSVVDRGYLGTMQ